MPVDQETVQQLAQQRANQLRVDESRPKRDPYAIQDPYKDVMAQEKAVLDDPTKAPGYAGFQRELQTQSNQANEKLRGRIAGVADPMAVGRELARMDQGVRNQLAVYMSQRQQDAQQALRQAAAGSAGFQMDQYRTGEDTRRYDTNLGEQRLQFDVGVGERERGFNESVRQFDAEMAAAERRFEENRRQFGLEYALRVREVEQQQAYQNQQVALEQQRIAQGSAGSTFSRSVGSALGTAAGTALGGVFGPIGGAIGGALGSLFGSSNKVSGASLKSAVGGARGLSNKGGH